MTNQLPPHMRTADLCISALSRIDAIIRTGANLTDAQVSDLLAAREAVAEMHRGNAR